MAEGAEPSAAASVAWRHGEINVRAVGFASAGLDAAGRVAAAAAAAARP